MGKVVRCEHLWKISLCPKTYGKWACVKCNKVWGDSKNPMYMGYGFIVYDEIKPFYEFYIQHLESK